MANLFVESRSVTSLTQEPEVLGSILVWSHTFVSPSTDSRRPVVSYWLKYVHDVLVNHLGGLSLPRKKCGLRLSDCPNMTVAFYHGQKKIITTQ